MVSVTVTYSGLSKIIISSLKHFYWILACAEEDLDTSYKKKTLALTLTENVTSQSIPFPKGIHDISCNLDIYLQYNYQ